ncbi:MAG: hypothetical protein CM15mP120_16130 [Pseudomonadota bacterium]|nr:MAG: hypothetical protein CM15mP120_16130 [Pseudomonadota bacterium]
MGPVMGLHEVPQDPHAQELGMFPKISHPELGDYTTVNIPMRLPTPMSAPRPIAYSWANIPNRCWKMLALALTTSLVCAIRALLNNNHGH